MKGPIQSVEVAYLLHATEDEAKVSGAVERLLGMGLEPDMERLEGHFGNEILRAKVHLVGDDASRAFSSLVGTMPQSLRKEVLADLGQFVDEHSALFLRFDKQMLVSGRLSLGASDPVRLKVKPRAYMIKGGAVSFYSQLFGGE